MSLGLLLFSIVLYVCFLIIFLSLIVLMKKKFMKIVFIVLAMSQLLAGVFIVVAGLYVTKDEPLGMVIEGAEYEAKAYEAYEMSVEQLAIIEQYGEPSGFLLLFLGEDLSERSETWYYGEQAMVFEFYDGILMADYEDEMLEEIDHEESDYHVTDFIGAIDPGTVMTVIDKEVFLLMPVEDVIEEDSVLYYLDDLVLGFVDDRLCYVETLPVEQ